MDTVIKTKEGDAETREVSTVQSGPEIDHTLRLSRSPLASVAAFGRAVTAVVWKDLVAEMRSKELISAMLVFSLIVAVIFSFALELRMDRASLVAPGLLWATFAFAGTLGLDRSLAIEKDRGCLDGLLLLPVERSALYFGKALGNLLFMLVVEAVILPLFTVLFNVGVVNLGVILIVIIGTIGFAAVGTLISTMAVNTRAREVMMPVLLFPTAIPLILSAVKATRGVLDGQPLADLVSWLGILIAYDLILLVLSYLTFEYVVEE